MQIGIFGTGMVGRVLSAALVAKGHAVMLGTRDPRATAVRREPDRYTGESFADWTAAHPAVRLGTYADAAAFGGLVMNATSGHGSLPAVQAAGSALDGKILIDIANPLDFSKGMPPSLFVGITDSLGEQIQRAAPKARVVKSLNTIAAPLMANPRALAAGDHTMFVAGDDESAKTTVTTFLRDELGWTDVIDIGGIEASRATESLLLPWARLFGLFGSPMLAFKVVR